MTTHNENTLTFWENIYAEYLKLFGNLDFRKKVCAIVIDANKKFLIVQLTSYGKNDWNFPGGGIEHNETVNTTALRELKEELGSTNFQIIKESNITSKYNWPNTVIIDRLKKKHQTYKGQEARYVLVKYLGDKKKLKPDPTEIRKIKWITKEEFKKYFNFANQIKETENIFKSLKI